jgi:hypothetical protein
MISIKILYSKKLIQTCNLKHETFKRELLNYRYKYY